MYCEHCGKYVEDESVFCGNCGQKISASEVLPVQTDAELERQENNTQSLPWLASNPKKEMNSDTVVYDTKDKRSEKKKTSIQNVIIIVLFAVIVVGGIFFWLLMKDDGNKSDVSNNSNVVTEEQENQVDNVKITSPSPSQTPTQETPPQSFDIEKLNEIIVRKTVASNVAVAILDCDTKQLYATSNAETPFVAAGFYLPLYIFAYDNGSAGTVISENADKMMVTMDNAAANSVINDLGGLQSVNELLRKNSYEKTVFNRNFGDVEASKQGKENYTSAKEAVSFLEILYDRHEYEKTSINLQSDGIILPNTGTVYAHRGLGIGTSFNVFAVVVNSNKSYCVAILTKDTGNTTETVKTNAASLISELFAEISRQVEDGSRNE